MEKKNVTPEEVLTEMIRYQEGDPKRIQHFIKVHGFAKIIGQGERMEPEALRILEIAAAVHDIGIKPAEEKYGSAGGKLQEQEGPPAARELLERLVCEPGVTERVCYLVGHHHTYHGIDGLDYQILVEADFLVNLFEEHTEKAGVEAAYRNIFRTESGKRICREMFGLKSDDGE